MNRVIVPIFFALSMALVVATGRATTAASRPIEAAQAATEQWLPLVDAGDYFGSWDAMAPSFKHEVSRAKWKSIIRNIRKPLGRLVSRKLDSADYFKELPGAPEGEYVVLKYNTTFENKPSATETITTILSADLEWNVTGYAVK